MHGAMLQYPVLGIVARLRGAYSSHSPSGNHIVNCRSQQTGESQLS